MPRVFALTVGDDGFVAIPQEILDLWKVGVGDALFMTETPTGIHLTRHDPERAKPAAGAGDETR